MGAPATVRGWGGGSGVSVRLVRPRGLDELHGALAAARSSGGAIARGLGRSYGDAAQLSGELVIDTSGLTGFELDENRGTVTAQAGATLRELLAALVPRGWMVPVVPGTQHVTVAGAIAGDIHGKNQASRARSGPTWRRSACSPRTARCGS